MKTRCFRDFTENMLKMFYQIDNHIYKLFVNVRVLVSAL